jgi:hypothetical protein
LYTYSTRGPTATATGMSDFAGASGSSSFSGYLDRSGRVESAVSADALLGIELLQAASLAPMADGG